MKVGYWLRVLIVSPEALLVVFTMLLWKLFHERLDVVVGSLAIDSDLKKYFMLLPLGLFAWNANEGRALLHEDKESSKILTSWPHYWKIKVHTCCALVYALAFALSSLVPWVSNLTLSTGLGVLIFLSSILGEVVVCVSFYWARVRVREILAQA